MTRTPPKTYESGLCEPPTYVRDDMPIDVALESRQRLHEDFLKRHKRGKKNGE